jgi:molybdopterin converting factor subunit 1
VKLLFFAKSRELAGTSQSTLSLTSTTLTSSHLLDIIIQHYPKLVVIRHNVVLAVNQSYVGPNDHLELSFGDEVAVIPPISGG